MTGGSLEERQGEVERKGGSLSLWMQTLRYLLLIVVMPTAYVWNNLLYWV